ncbi:hypothetical protein C0J52_17940 [Blattella germanica]|nr:hypothetical protein C0J52_17940 [Blattella germanica]
MVASKAQISLRQVQTFGTYGQAVPDGSQQQFYQSSAPVQGLRLQLSNPGVLNLLQNGQQQSLGPTAYNQKYILRVRVKPTALRELKYESHVVPITAAVGSHISSFALSQLATQPAYTNELPQQYQQQLNVPQQYQTQSFPQQYQTQSLNQQSLQLQDSVAATAAQFRNSLTQPVRFRVPAPVTQTTSESGTHTTGKTAPVANLLGVAFSPASDVSQLRFSGSFANYSY